MNHYQEESILFGNQSALLGVITRPTVQRPSDVACLMFNFGVMHHIGPRRLQVKLARQLARQGVATLRFDLSGLGDSRASTSPQSFEDQAQDDLRAAIDLLEAKAGVGKVAVLGLCSGVGHGLKLAVNDPRVSALLAFDGYSFVSRGAKLMRIARRFARFPAAQTRHWIDRLLGRNRPEEGLLQTGERAEVMTPQRFQEEMDLLIARQVAVYLIYSATLQKHDRNFDQLHALRGSAFLEKVRYEFMPKVDHSFTQIASQQLFIASVCRWMEDLQPSARPEPTRASAPAPDPQRRPARNAVQQQTQPAPIAATC